MIKSHACPLLSLAMWFGAFAGIAQADEKGSSQLAEQARGVLKQSCARCHNGPGSEGGDRNFLDREDLVKTSPDAKSRQLFAPGKPGESYILERILLQEMPPPGNPPPSPDDIKVLWTWVKEGAAPFPTTAARPHKSIQAVLTQARDHLEKLPEDDQRYQRFFTLHHLANQPLTSDGDLQTARAALSKAINSLHWQPQIIVPKGIDPEQTLFVVDLRELGWDRNEMWKRVLDAYPYGLSFESRQDLREIERKIVKGTGSQIPLIRGDWFVANATRPPLYHSLLYDNFIPELKSRPIDPMKAAGGNPKAMTLADLESFLHIEHREQYLKPAPNQIAYAGFPKSGVSGQNRHLARLRGTYGLYWVSSDFKPDSSRANLVRFPMGALNLFAHGKHPFKDRAFVQDGGEAIFRLPNGLHGYLLVDGKGGRIDEGPIVVVSDALKTSGTPAIVNGVSCMSCHKNGMLELEDAIRENSAVFGDLEVHVRKLYPAAAEMDKLVEQDQQNYMLALKEAIGPFLNPSGAAARPLEDLPDPVGEVARRYRLGYLDLQTVASELELENPADLFNKLGDRKMKELGLDTLRNKGLIPRLEWEGVEDRYRPSLMQEVARNLGLDFIK